MTWIIVDKNTDKQIIECRELEEAEKLLKHIGANYRIDMYL